MFKILNIKMANLAEAKREALIPLKLDYIAEHWLI